jgi:hypothetical protein
MGYLQWICTLLLFLSLNAIYVAPVKIYPVIFLLFACSVCIALVCANAFTYWPRFHKTAWYGCCTYLLYVLAVFGAKGGDPVVLIKIVTNVAFFLLASLFFLLMARDGKTEVVRKTVVLACLVSILLSFVQALVNVSIGHLWLLPLSITNSSDAYAIQEASKIYFGDENKNIWATKTVLSFLTLFVLRDSRWRIKDTVTLGLFLFVIVYTASRTAQLALLVGMSLYALHETWPRIRFVGKSCMLAFTVGVVTMGLVYSRLSSIELDVSQGHGGEGLLARVILWKYFVAAVPEFSFSESIVGHGVFAVSSFVGRLFDENNLHNVFLNQFFDFGVVGLLLYCCFLSFFFSSLSAKGRWLFVPAVLIAINSQYFGYDPELMILFAVSLLIGDASGMREGQELPGHKPLERLMFGRWLSLKKSANNPVQGL